MLNELNQQLNSKEISQKKITLKSKPITLDVTLTTKCNLSCRMCGVIKKHWQISHKTLSEIKSLIPYLSFTTWQGGEAFLYPHFKDLLEETHKYSNIVQTIYTNGLLIDEFWMEELIKGPKTICISIDGVTEDIYEHIRRGAKFKILLKKLELINKYKEKSEFHIEIHINVVIMKSNYLQIDKFIKFAKDHNISKVEFSPVEGYIKDENIFKYQDKQALDFLKKIRPDLEKLAEEHNIRIFNRLPYGGMICDKDLAENYRGNLFCTLPWTFLFILPGGKVIPHGSCKRFIGNVEEQSILQIWNSPKMQEYRHKLLTNDYKNWCGESLNWMDII